MNRYGAIALIVAVPVTVTIGLLSTPYPLPSSIEAPTVCVEDQPCWDCSSMGNLRCGPTVERSSIER